MSFMKSCLTALVVLSLPFTASACVWTVVPPHRVVPVPVPIGGIPELIARELYGKTVYITAFDREVKNAIEEEVRAAGAIVTTSSAAEYRFSLSMRTETADRWTKVAVAFLRVERKEEFVDAKGKKKVLNVLVWSGEGRVGYPVRTPPYAKKQQAVNATLQALASLH